MGAAHSVLSPSSAKRWTNCPGSVALVAKAPKEPPNIYAAEGTVAHALAEELVLGKVSVADLQKRVGQKVKQDGFDVEITDEMVTGAAEYLDSVEEARMYFRTHPRLDGPQWKEQLEGRIVASSIGEDVWGRCDYYAYRKGDSLYVFDYKFGRRSVDAERNDQAMIYAIGVMDQEAGWAFTDVIIRIIQPRRMDGGPTTREWFTTPAELKKWRDEKAAPAAVESGKPEAKLVPGTWCDDTFCPARSSCKALQAKVGEIVQADFAVVPPKAVSTLPANQPLPDTSLMTVEQQEKALLWRDVVDGWFKALEASLQQKAEAGERLTHWKLVEGRAGNRTWTDEEKVKAKWGKDAVEQKVLTPAALEKRLKLKPEDTAELTTKTPGKRTLAVMSDKREAVNGVRDDFAPVCKGCEVGFCTTHKKVVAPPAQERKAEATPPKAAKNPVWPWP